MPRAGISHLDLVVSSIERSLPFYRGLLEPLGYSRLREIVGERGETIWYISIPDRFEGAVVAREGQSRAAGHDRYAVGIHHVCFNVASRAVVDERTAWLRE